MSKKQKFIGIDLGTTNSEVAIIEDDKIKVLPVDGSPVVPSVVSLDKDGNVLVGQTALNNRLVNPENTIQWIKRKMGQETIVALGNKDYTPPMISALILSHLKRAAEEYVQEEITRAVITVPAFYNDIQRNAVKKAGELAGLEVLKLLNEPTSAALAYTLGEKKKETCLVYDLGGGTFDVSVVNLSNDIMEVLASEGDTQLGGADFDLLIAEKIKIAFLQQYNVDLSKDTLSWFRLLIAAEKAKIELSTNASVEILEEFIACKNNVALHLKHTITRKELEDLIRPIISRTIQSTKHALKQASLSIDGIDKIILVGGSTYMPLVSQMLEEEFKIAPQACLDPKLIVAQGAAVEASNLCGKKIGSMMIDIITHSLGVSSLDENDNLVNSFLIRRNSPLPSVASRIFYKLYYGQETVELGVYQGESRQIDQNKHLGDVILKDLKVSDGNEIFVKFEIDNNGMLNVSAEDVHSKKSVKVTIKRGSKSRKENINIAEIKKAGLSEEQDNKDIKNTEKKEKLKEELLAKALNVLEKKQLDSQGKKELEDLIDKVKKNEEGTVNKLEELLYFIE